MDVLVEVPSLLCPPSAACLALTPTLTPTLTLTPNQVPSFGQVRLDIAHGRGLEVVSAPRHDFLAARGQLRISLAAPPTCCPPLAT